METKKRLSEWTLAECKEYCINRCKKSSPCDGCILSKNICVGDVCQTWKFETLTDGEKAIMRACGAKWVTKGTESGNTALWRKKPNKCDGSWSAAPGGWIGNMDEKLFKSVSGGDCIELED